MSCPKVKRCGRFQHHRRQVNCYQQRHPTPCVVGTTLQPREQHEQQQNIPQQELQKERQQQLQQQPQQQPQHHMSSIRFHSKIDNPCATPSQITLKAPDEATNDVVDSSNASCEYCTSVLPEAVTRKQAHSDLECCEVVCSVKYGDIRQVQVQFVASDHKRCAHLWKQKRRVHQRKRRKQHRHWTSCRSSTLSSLSSSVEEGAPARRAGHNDYDNDADDDDDGGWIDDDDDEGGWIDDDDEDQLATNVKPEFNVRSFLTSSSCCRSPRKSVQQEARTDGGGGGGDRGDASVMWSSKANVTESIGDSQEVDGDDDVFWPPSENGDGDHNRIITPPVQQQQQLQSITPTTTPTNNKNGTSIFNGSNNSGSSVGGGGGGSGGSKPQTPTTENSNGLTPQQHRHERNNNNSNHHSSNNSNNNNNSSNNVSPKTTTTTTARSNSQNSSPVLSQYYGNRRSNNDGTPPPTTTGTATTTKTVDEKTSTKLLLSSNSNSNSRKQIQPQHRSLEEEGATSDESHPSDELQQLKYLNRHSCNGRLDYQSLEQHLQQTAEAQQQQNKGIEAMGALMQYLVFDLDAFACSGIKAERTKLEERLTRTLQQLDEAKSVCSELQDTLCDKEAYYTQREEELQDLHRCELEKVQRNVSEMQLRASEQISALKIELHVKEAEQKRSLDCYRLEMENKLALKHQQLLTTQQSEKALLERITELENNGLNLRMELKSAEESSAQRLQATTKRERDLLEKLRVLNKELDILRETKASNERDLKDKLNLSQEEVSVLRTSSRRSLNSESLSGSSPRNSSSASIAAAMEITRLQSEAESLRCVLELKQKEISKLTKHNEELLRDADERASLQAKISLLEARNEMLQSELEIKSEKEKEFQRQMDEIQKAFNHETVKRTRLSYDNEALQWQLKQRSEQLHIVEAKLQELSSQDLQTSQNSSLGSLNRSHNGASLLNVHADDEVSPPVSPIIKAVIEKTDSVSWVLEMDDDTPEAAASKMVKRAGSFRSFERSPSTRRHLSVSANAATSAANTSGQGPGPNPLSQSMSAASVIRQHSNEAVDCLGRSNSRIRSKSVSVKSAEPTPSKSNKKVLRQSSTGSNRKNELVPPVWKEPMNTSSPYTVSRPRSSTLKCAEQEEAFYRSSARKLITCDTSALNSGERLELRGLPTHPSVQDLKAPKKSQQIQESAGEAMVSGTNSEDEGCSHSSDEVVSSSTTSISSAASATSGSSLSLHHIKSHQHMSLEEEVLLLDKINSLNGTPMEVSWSDEADAFATNTTAV